MTAPPTPVSEWVRLAPAEALPIGSAVRVDLDGEAVALFHTPDGLFALAEDCPHMGGPLSQGEVADGTVTCPLHLWRYDLATGERLGRKGAPIPTYPVEARDGWLFLGLPARGRVSTGTTQHTTTSADPDPISSPISAGGQP